MLIGCGVGLWQPTLLCIVVKVINYNLRLNLTLINYSKLNKPLPNSMSSKVSSRAVKVVKNSSGDVTDVGINSGDIVRVRLPDRKLDKCCVVRTAHNITVIMGDNHVHAVMLGATLAVVALLVSIHRTIIRLTVHTCCGSVSGVLVGEDACLDLVNQLLIVVAVVFVVRLVGHVDYLGGLGRFEPCEFIVLFRDVGQVDHGSLARSVSEVAGEDMELCLIGFDLIEPSRSAKYPRCGYCWSGGLIGYTEL